VVTWNCGAETFRPATDRALDARRIARPDHTPTCTSATSCTFTVPTFTGTNHGVLPSTVTSGTQATVGFDITADGGRDWTLASQRPVSVIPNTTQKGEPRLGYPLVSVASPSSWWVLGWSSAGLTTQVSADAGANWTETTAPAPTGVPIELAALDGTHALLTIENDTSTQISVHMLATANSGRSWKTVNLPG
jgi:hypothetical protein